MKALRFFCAFFAVIFGLTAFSCIINLFNPGRNNSVGELVLLGILMIALAAVCIFGAIKSGENVKKIEKKPEKKFEKNPERKTEKKPVVNDKHTIVKTKIIDTYGKSSTASAASRGIVGNALAGPVGAIVGASTAKQKRSTTFLIFYKDGRRMTRTVPNNSFEYQNFIKYLSD